MAWSATAEPERFDDAADWFANRIPVTEALADTLDEYAAQRAFKVAGVAQLDIVQQVHSSLLKAIEDGIPFEDWKKQIEPELSKAWGKKDSPRIETVFRNATQQSYNAGRWRQMNEPDVLAHRPYGMFDGVVDQRQSAICKAWDGKILPMEDFERHGVVPQCHHRCRSGIQSLRESEARRRGITATPPEERAATGFGKAPDKSDWAVDESKYDPTLLAEYKRKRDEIEKSATRHRVPVKE